jgi:hypothetical protein
MYPIAGNSEVQGENTTSGEFATIENPAMRETPTGIFA